MHIYLRDIMGSPPITIDEDASAQDALDRMRMHEIHALPVVDDQRRPVGVIALEDAIDKRGDTQVRGIMSAPPLTVEVFQTIRDAAEVMRERKIHHVVVTHQEEAVGVVSSFDLVELICTHRLVPDKDYRAPELGSCD